MKFKRNKGSGNLMSGWDFVFCSFVGVWAGFTWHIGLEFIIIGLILWVLFLLVAVVSNYLNSL